jgi:hypothetical protein
MRTYPSARRALAAVLATVAIVLGVISMIFPGAVAPSFILGITDVMLGVSIVLGIVIIRSVYDR